MSRTTVAEFANELKKSTDVLLDQLKQAGVPKHTSADELTDADKHKLLSYLQSSHGTNVPERKKITLVKKQTTEIKQADSSGKARTIQVEVRKKRTFVRREDGTDQVIDVIETDAPAEPQVPVIDHAELLRREEDARRQAELIRRQEEELALRRKEREEQEQRAREAAEQQAAHAAEEKARQAAQAATRVAPPVSLEPEPAIAAAAAAAVQAQEVAQASAVAAKERAIATAAEASRAIAAEEVARAADLGERRRKAEAEAAAIRTMMSAPKKVMLAKKPEEIKPPVDPKAGLKGTLHKPAAGSTVAKPAKPAAPAAPGTAAGAGKEVKSAKLSSSWAGEAGKKKELKTRGDTSAGAGRSTNWRSGPRGKRGGSGFRDSRDGQSAQNAPAETRIIEVHVPETITVAELAHKMAVKASEVIKQLMKLGQMVTINQPLDQDTAMIVVEDLGHKAVVAALDDPEAFTDD